MIVSGKETHALKVKCFALKGSTIRAKDMIFLSSISSKKKYNDNGSRVKFLSSDVIEKTKRKLINDFDLEAILSSDVIEDTKSKVEVSDGCDKKNYDKAKKRKRKNNDSKKQKVYDEVCISENEFVDESELYVEVDKSKMIKKKNTVSVDEKSDFDDGWLSLRTRSSPKVLYSLMSKLTLAQRKDLIEIGFGSLYNMAVEEIPVKIGHFVVDNFFPNEMKLKLQNYDIEITPELIHSVLGVPLGGIDFHHLAKTRVSDLSRRWYLQFIGRYPTPKKVADVVKQTKVDGILFKLSILVLFSKFFGLGGKGEQCRPQEILKYICEDTKISSIDWCKYVYDSLKVSKKGWVRDDSAIYYSGPLTALIVSVHFNTLIYIFFYQLFTCENFILYFFFIS